MAIFGTFFFKIAYISVISIQYTTTYSNRSMPDKIQGVYCRAVSPVLKKNDKNEPKGRQKFERVRRLFSLMKTYSLIPGFWNTYWRYRLGLRTLECFWNAWRYKSIDLFCENYERWGKIIPYIKIKMSVSDLDILIAGFELIQYAASFLDFLDFLVFEPFQKIEIKDRQRTKNVAFLIVLASYNQWKVSPFQLPRRLQWSLIRLDDTKKLKLPKSLFLKPGSVQWVLHILDTYVWLLQIHHNNDNSSRLKNTTFHLQLKL